MSRHYPIKVNQNEITFLVQFPNEAEFEAFQEFIRDNQVNALTNGQYPGVELWWPERDIKNWKGIVKGPFKAGGARRNYVPRAQFSVYLIESMTSQRTFTSSVGAGWQTIVGVGSPDGLLQPPNAQDQSYLDELFGARPVEESQGGGDLVTPDPTLLDNLRSGKLGIP